MNRKQVNTILEKTRKILLINDLAGYGKVALSVMFPILSNMKYELFNLPTALVSNTLDYGKFHILETTDYLRESIKVWGELGFQFDAICTGFLVSEEQTKLISHYCQDKRKQGTPIFVDPIMGDDGKLYNGVTGNTIQYMREMCSVADIIMPNLTEAEFLAGMFVGKASLTKVEIHQLLDALKALTAGSIVVTSANVEGHMETLVYDAGQDEIYHQKYSEVQVRFPGTGDIFSSVLIGNYLMNQDLPGSVIKAMEEVERLIKLNVNNVDKYKGIPIELYMGGEM